MYRLAQHRGARYSYLCPQKKSIHIRVHLGIAKTAREGRGDEDAIIAFELPVPTA
jgi:hypothetical protein